jgi:hypothetical protein
MTNDLYVLIALNTIIFILGYSLGKHTRPIEHNNSVGFLSKNKNTKEASKKADIDIDERKIVTKINTDNLEKKYDSLAQTQVSQNDIGESINKLKNLKR